MRLVNCKKIKNQEDQRFYHYELGLLGKADLLHIMDLQEQVIAGMDRKEERSLNEKIHKLWKR